MLAAPRSFCEWSEIKNVNWNVEARELCVAERKGVQKRAEPAASTARSKWVRAASVCGHLMICVEIQYGQSQRKRCHSFVTHRAIPLCLCSLRNAWTQNIPWIFNFYGTHSESHRTSPKCAALVVPTNIRRIVWKITHSFNVTLGSIKHHIRADRVMQHETCVQHSTQQAIVLAVLIARALGPSWTGRICRRDLRPDTN